MIDLKVGSGLENSSLTLEATMGPYKDTVVRTTKVVPSGFPFAISCISFFIHHVSNLSDGGILKANSKLEHKFSIPDVYIAGSVVSTT